MPPTVGTGNCCIWRVWLGYSVKGGIRMDAGSLSPSKMMLSREVSSITPKNLVNCSLALQLSPNSGSWILSCHIKLQQLQSQRRANLAFGNDTSITAISCTCSALCCWHLQPPYLHFDVQDTKSRRSRYRSEWHSGKEQSLTCGTPTKKRLATTDLEP